MTVRAKITGMQRTDDDGVIISCDFCGTDWDPLTGLPVMTEGHRGSAMCLDCLQRALPEHEVSGTAFDCTLCLQRRDAGTRAWRGPREGVTACWPCIRLAAKTFHKDREVDFRWDPSVWPKDEG